eukprot:TRINITY_DN414_c0_g1_i2.p1 TRINITY_DN414_c0_g1~~TRINITY_DN414_c0_g1_i2.p1  ORF type:complete len:626 (+),score=95.19 TRINITY_DN414_c0_g1_i2:617-2494(+)
MEEYTRGCKVDIQRTSRFYRDALRAKNTQARTGFVLASSRAEPLTVGSFFFMGFNYRRLRHPNIVLFMGTIRNGEEVKLVTELLSRGSLLSVLKDASIPLSFSRIVKIAYDAARGMNYLHKNSPIILHRDLKSSNLLVDEHFTVKVSDFGLAKLQASGPESGYAGTISYAAPELFAGEQPSTMSDVYSFSIILWELLTRKEPFSGLDRKAIIFSVGSEGVRPPLPENGVDLEYLQLIKDCWQEDDLRRPTFSEILRTLEEIEKRCMPSVRVDGAPILPDSQEEPSSGELPREKETQRARKNGRHDEAEAVERVRHYKTPRGKTLEMWGIDVGELEFGEKIGNGASAEVHRGKYRGQDVAIKILTKKMENKHIDEFMKELLIMKNLRSPFVVYFYGGAVEPSCCIVTELLSHGSLFDVMNDSQLSVDFNWPFIFKLASEAARGMNALHCWKPSVLHRDLKSMNLLVDENWAVKVCDFGLARFNQIDEAPNSTFKKLRGTYAYCSPESYNPGQLFTTKSDVFSFGIILWELCHRKIYGRYKLPYEDNPNIRFDFQIIIQTAKFGLRPRIDSECPQLLADLMKQCWDPDPNVRPSFKEIISLLNRAKQVVLTPNDHIIESPHKKHRSS